MFSKYKFILFILLFIFFVLPHTVSAQVTINEYLPDSNQEWIEFYNSSPSAEYIKSYYIDDDTDFLSDTGSSSKKALTTLNVTNPQFPYIETSSFLNNSGDFVVLFDQAGNLVDQHQFTSNPGNNISIGRYPDGSGTFYTLSYLTKADSNPSPPTPSPTPNPTQAPTTQPTQAPTAIATVKPTPTKSPSPKPTATPTDETEETEKPTENKVSSLLTEIVDATPIGLVAGASTKNSASTIATIFVSLGVLFLGYGGYLLYNNRLKGNENNSSPQE